MPDLEQINYEPTIKGLTTKNPFKIKKKRGRKPGLKNLGKSLFPKIPKP